MTLIEPEYEPPSNEQEAFKLCIEITDCLKKIVLLDRKRDVERLTRLPTIYQLWPVQYQQKKVKA